jgi:hypothetical protein
MSNNILTVTPSSNILTWTNAAITCYKLGCNCSECHILENCESISPKTCFMKSVVLGLVRKYGKPGE